MKLLLQTFAFGIGSLAGKAFAGEGMFGQPIHPLDGPQDSGFVGAPPGHSIDNGPRSLRSNLDSQSDGNGPFPLRSRSLPEGALIAGGVSGGDDRGGGGAEIAPASQTPSVSAVKSLANSLSGGENEAAVASETKTLTGSVASGLNDGNDEVTIDGKGEDSQVETIKPVVSSATGLNGRELTLRSNGDEDDIAVDTNKQAESSASSLNDREKEASISSKASSLTGSVATGFNGSKDEAALAGGSMKLASPHDFGSTPAVIGVQQGSTPAVNGVQQVTTDPISVPKFDPTKTNSVNGKKKRWYHKLNPGPWVSRQWQKLKEKFNRRFPKKNNPVVVSSSASDLPAGIFKKPWYQVWASAIRKRFQRPAKLTKDIPGNVAASSSENEKSMEETAL